MKDKFWMISIIALTIFSLVAFGLVAFGVVGGAPAQAAAARTIAINGTGSVYLPPDMATINLGVMTDAAEVKDATAESNRVIEEIRRVLDEYGVAASDVQTTYFSVYPMSDYGFEMDPESASVYYRVDNSVTVIVRDLSQLGEILDAVIVAGANSIYGIQFGVSDQEAAYLQAMEAAVENARERAEALAQASGAELGELQSTSTYFGSGGYPMTYAEAAGMGGGGSVPISPGSMEIRVDVSVVFEIK